MATKKREQKPRHEPFEGRNPTGKFYKITADMVESPAWIDLSLTQTGLYFKLKTKYQVKKSGGVIISTNENDISLPVSEWGPLYHWNYRAYKRDMDALKEHGFIKVVENNRYTRQANIYGLSAEWTKWTPPPTHAIAKQDEK